MYSGLLQSLRSLKGYVETCTSLFPPVPPLDGELPRFNNTAEIRTYWWHRETWDMGTMADPPDHCSGYPLENFSPCSLETTSVTAVGAHNGTRVIFAGLLLLLVVAFFLFAVRFLIGWTLLGRVSVFIPLRRLSIVCSSCHLDLRGL